MSKYLDKEKDLVAKNPQPYGRCSICKDLVMRCETPTDKRFYKVYYIDKEWSDDQYYRGKACNKCLDEGKIGWAKGGKYQHE